MPLDKKTVDTLTGVTTATLTTVLLKKGLRNIWLRGTKPLRSGQPRIVGPAFTLRFVPAREDLATPESWASPTSTRAAIECMPAGCVAVVDAMGVTDAGIFGDILCERIRVREVAVLITDGVIRDLAGVLRTNLPVWCQGTAAPASVAGLTSSAGRCPSPAVASQSSLTTSSSSMTMEPSSSQQRSSTKSSRPQSNRRNSKPGLSTRSAPAFRSPDFTHPTPRPKPGTRPFAPHRINR
jgi:regulator of RNase E activity RraA